jgi:hypothetical protein
MEVKAQEVVEEEDGGVIVVEVQEARMEQQEAAKEVDGGAMEAKAKAQEVVEAEDGGMTVVEEAHTEVREAAKKVDGGAMEAKAQEVVEAEDGGAIVVEVQEALEEDKVVAQETFMEVEDGGVGKTVVEVQEAHMEDQEVGQVATKEVVMELVDLGAKALEVEKELPEVVDGGAIVAEVLEALMEKVHERTKEDLEEKEEEEEVRGLAAVWVEDEAGLMLEEGGSRSMTMKNLDSMTKATALLDKKGNGPMVEELVEDIKGEGTGQVPVLVELEEEILLRTREEEEPQTKEGEELMWIFLAETRKTLTTGLVDETEGLLGEREER